MNTYIWLIRREFWENRAIWLLPAVTAAALLVIALFGQAHIDELPFKLNQQQVQVVGPLLLFGFGIVLFAIMSIYSAWYLLDCLYAERKDRSILFWKSLPITDTETVLSKLAMGILVIPLVYFAAADLTALGVAFILSVRHGATLMSGLWRVNVWFELQVLWIYLIVATAIWYLPITGWFMLVSAWAKRAVSLWALVAPLALCFIEIKLFGSYLVATWLKVRLLEFGQVAFHGESRFSAHTMFQNDELTTPQSVWELIDAGALFSNPQTWVGIGIGVAFIAAAIALRRRSTEL